MIYGPNECYSLSSLKCKVCKNECNEAYRRACIHANLQEAHRKATNEADGSVKSWPGNKTDNRTKKSWPWLTKIQKWKAEHSIEQDVLPLTHPHTKKTHFWPSAASVQSQKTFVVIKIILVIHPGWRGWWDVQMSRLSVTAWICSLCVFERGWWDWRPRLLPWGFWGADGKSSPRIDLLAFNLQIASSVFSAVMAVGRISLSLLHWWQL